MRFSITLLLLFATLGVVAQSTVNRKVAQRWDKHNGSVWQGQDSVVYTYNSNGDEQVRLIENTPSVNQWSPFFRFTSTYDAQQNLQTRSAQQWLNNAWKNVTKYTYAYNGSNQQTEIIYQTSNSTNAWINTGRSVTSYAGNLRTELITYGWVSNMWSPQTRQLFQYNSSGELTIHDFYDFTNNVWVVQERRQYLFAFGQVSSLIKSVADINGNLVLQSYTLNLINGSAVPPRIVSSEVKRRDLAGNSWEDSLKTAYLYTNNLLVSKEKEQYKPSLNSWINIAKSTYDYNASNLVEDEKNFVTNGATSVYNNQSRKVYTYNTNSLNDAIRYYVDDNNNGWALSGQDSYSYNSNDSLIYNLNETYSNNTFSPLEQYFYYYQNVTVGLADLQPLFRQASLYPNPCTDKVKIKTKETIIGAHEATVYSMEGKIIWSQLNTQPLANCVYDFGALPSGNYILQLKSVRGNKAQQFQFTKK